MATTILVVDDDRAIRTLVRVFLEGAGYNVLIASDGAEAVSIFQQYLERIALLLTDVVMAKMDGLQLADAVLTLRPQLPVIFISASMHHADRGYGCIGKPLTSGKIVGRVRQVLAATELSRPRHSLRIRLLGEPPCEYTIVSEHRDYTAVATTLVKGQDGYLYQCVQSVSGRRVWSRFPREYQLPQKQQAQGRKASA